ncbi:hypothetical protein [Paenibacillus sp. NEAU-GSW1]|nr:hypothetical protein [Paenibacillus sp. NEAU-GSW1]MUT68553.1 hypothetical protein [Paenibacillus sp. NEAU-GSW1]
MKKDYLPAIAAAKIDTEPVYLVEESFLEEKRPCFRYRIDLYSRAEESF